MGRTTKVGILYERDKTVKGGFSGPIEIACTSFLVKVGGKGCYLKISMWKNEGIIKK